MTHTIIHTYLCFYLFLNEIQNPEIIDCYYLSISLPVFEMKYKIKEWLTVIIFLSSTCFCIVNQWLHLAIYLPTRIIYLLLSIYVSTCFWSGIQTPGVGVSLVGFFKLNTWLIRSLLYVWVKRYLQKNKNHLSLMFLL